MPRKRDIEAAIAAHNRDDRERLLLPPEAARLLSVMFPKDTVYYRGSVASLVGEGSTRRAVTRLLEGLVEAGFLSKDLGRRGIICTYRLHLPRLVRR